MMTVRMIEWTRMRYCNLCVCLAIQGNIHTEYAVCLPMSSYIRSWYDGKGKLLILYLGLVLQSCAMQEDTWPLLLFGFVFRYLDISFCRAHEHYGTMEFR